MQEEDSKTYSKNGVKFTKENTAKPNKKKIKLKHINVLKRHLKRWSKSPHRGNIMIETLVHPLKDGKSLLSLRQFQLNEEKSASGNLLVIHEDNIKCFSKQLSKISDDIKAKLVKDVVIDEWHLESNQSKFRRELSDFTVEKMKYMFWPVVKEECYACEIGEPSQRYHQCLANIETNVSNIFDKLLKRIDWVKLCFECKQNVITAEELLKDEEWCERTINKLIVVLNNM